VFIQQNLNGLSLRSMSVISDVHYNRVRYNEVLLYYPPYGFLYSRSCGRFRGTRERRRLQQVVLHRRAYQQSNTDRANCKQPIDIMFKSCKPSLCPQYFIKLVQVLCSFNFKQALNMRAETICGTSGSQGLSEMNIEHRWNKKLIILR
jgi:hypothetical protein